MKVIERRTFSITKNEANAPHFCATEKKRSAERSVCAPIRSAPNNDADKIFVL
jgi:hypothetical protein